MSLKNKSVLVSGGAGFIGSHLVDRIVKEEPENLVVVDNFFLGDKSNQEDAKRNYPNLKIYDQADPNGPYTGTEGTPITFDGSDSYDPDGSIVSYDWDFGDLNTSSEVNPTNTYAQNGTYTVLLTVTDNNSATDTNTTTATIGDTESIANLTITSAENKITSASTCIKLNFTVEPAAVVTLDWVAYSLDGNANVTIEGNPTVLDCMDNAPYDHNIVVYARDSYGNELSSITVFFTVHTGDVNEDFYVNLEDLTEVRHALSSTPGDDNWNENADLNCDNVVDNDDLQTLPNYFFRSY